MGTQRPIDLQNETVARMVAAAEELFAEHGHENVSLRQLTARAAINVAAVNYYFGSKELLVEAVFEKLAQRVSAQRKHALEQLRDPGPDLRVYLEKLVRSFVEPYLGDENETQGLLLARFFLRHRLHPTDGTKRIAEVYLNPIAKEYIAAFTKACPQVPGTEFYWRYLFMVNTLVISSAEDTSFDRLGVLSDGEITNTSKAERREALIRFLVGAFWGGDS